MVVSSHTEVVSMSKAFSRWDIMAFSTVRGQLVFMAHKLGYLFSNILKTHASEQNKITFQLGCCWITLAILSIVLSPTKP